MSKLIRWLNAQRQRLTALVRNIKDGPLKEPGKPEEVCCSNTVHIAFRGVSDDRMYLSYNRAWAEVKYFKPHGLRVFCATCRRRVL